MIIRRLRAFLLLLFAASPAFAQLGPVPLAGLSVQPQGAAISRPLAQKLSDQLSVLDFGAACDGKTDDSSAVMAAGKSGTRVTVPGGLVCNAPNVAQGALTGSFAGGGKIRTNVGNPAGPYSLRGPQFSSITAPPNPQAWDQMNSAQDNCSAGFPCWANYDYSHTFSAEEFHVSGAATLGQPVHGYEGMPGTNAHQLFMDSSSGANYSHNSNDGRTGVGAYNVVLQTSGGGDTGVYGAQLLCGGHTPPGDGNTIAGPNGIINGYTDWLGVPNCGFQGGNISAIAPGQYLQMQEFHLSDQGNDVSAIGSVMGYDRTATTAKINNRWIHSLATCNLAPAANAIPCDAAYVVGGEWLFGMDFAGFPGGPMVQVPVAMMANQKITLNSFNNDSEGNPAKTVLGGDWITDDGTGVVVAQNGASAARFVNNPSAVNYWQITGSASPGNPVTAVATGSDAAIPILFSDKGGAGVLFQSNGSLALRVASSVASAGYLNVAAGAAGSPLTIADYSLANQDLALAAAGTGVVRLLGTTPAAADSSNAAATTGFVQTTAKTAVSAMNANRYKILNVGAGAAIPLPVPAGVISEMVVEIQPNSPTIGSMTLTMPASSAIPDGFIVHFITTGTITNFTVPGNSGQTVLGAPGTISPSTPVAFMWDSALTDWIAFR